MHDLYCVAFIETSATRCIAHEACYLAYEACYLIFTLDAQTTSSCVRSCAFQTETANCQWWTHRFSSMCMCTCMCIFTCSVTVVLVTQRCPYPPPSTFATSKWYKLDNKSSKHIWFWLCILIPQNARWKVENKVKVIKPDRKNLHQMQSVPDQAESYHECKMYIKTFWSIKLALNQVRPISLPHTKKSWLSRLDSLTSCAPILHLIVTPIWNAPEPQRCRQHTADLPASSGTKVS